MAKNLLIERITVNPNIRFGKPCIKGTRIAVADILNLLTGSYTIDEIAKQYPGISKKDVIAAIEFATQLAEEPTKVITQK